MCESDSFFSLFSYIRQYKEVRIWNCLGAFGYWLDYNSKMAALFESERRSDIRSMGIFDGRVFITDNDKCRYLEGGREMSVRYISHLTEYVVRRWEVNWELIIIRGFRLTKGYVTCPYRVSPDKGRLQFWLHWLVNFF